MSRIRSNVKSFPETKDRSVRAKTNYCGKYGYRNRVFQKSRPLCRFQSNRFIILLKGNLAFLNGVFYSLVVAHVPYLHFDLDIWFVPVNSKQPEMIIHYRPFYPV